METRPKSDQNGAGGRRPIWVPNYRGCKTKEDEGETPLGRGLGEGYRLWKSGLSIGCSDILGDFRRIYIYIYVGTHIPVPWLLATEGIEMTECGEAKEATRFHRS